MVKFIETGNAPKAIGPYSQAVSVQGHEILFISGQIPLDPVSSSLIQGDIRLEVRQVLKNIHAVLTDAGFAKENVVKCTIYLTDLGLFNDVNTEYAGFFGEHKPARATVGVFALPRSVRVEIDAIAIK
jgi:2-iminobutanoate/2-iminopropanoate deaminase